MKKILIIQTASIGDVILVTPVLENLHRKYPDAAIDVLVKKGTESLFASHPYLRKLYIWDKSDKKLRNLYIILKEVQSERYDLVINVQRFFLSGFLTAFSRAGKTVGFNKNPFSIFFSKRLKHKIREGEFHETERNLLLIQNLVQETEKRPVVYPSKQDDALTSQYKTHQYICVAPASLWHTKQYPADKWVEFLQQLPDDLYVYFLGSPADHALCEDIIKRSSHNNSMNLAGKLKLLETASLQRDALMNFVNDSAPMHLASAVNAPVTAIFCSTVPAFGFGPLSTDSVVLETEEKLDCRPCGLHGLRECPEKHFDCAYTIKTERLLKRVQ
ncbi:MAG: glycosyltransferase family 9 protein [Bacteroidales bacterium]|nr:glycosyltransferase family 9 protein [Bacteroidales bacterium]